MTPTYPQWIFALSCLAAVGCDRAFTSDCEAFRTCPATADEGSIEPTPDAGGSGGVEDPQGEPSRRLPGQGGDAGGLDSPWSGSSDDVGLLPWPTDGAVSGSYDGGRWPLDAADPGSILPECEARTAGARSCDDGNTDETDACPTTCQIASCGDGFVQDGVEQCDDGNDDDTDACPTTCQTARCGDGFVKNEEEACDDGNDIDTDGCLATCEVASCGDGHVFEPMEQCDPVASPEDCSSSCKWTWDPRGHCALQRVTGAVKCWGPNNYGQLGLGDTVDRGNDPGEMGDRLPTVDLGTGRRAVFLAAHRNHRCAILDDGSVKCWGRNQYGQCGVNHTDDLGDEPGDMGDALPTVDLGTGRTALQVALGYEHTCALLDNGQVKCWGSNFTGQLGIGSSEDQGDEPGEMGDALPVADLGSDVTALELAVGSYHSCVLLDNGLVKCWGSNAFAQLGRAGTATTYEVGDEPKEMGDALPYVPVGVVYGIRAIEAGGNHTCVLSNLGRVKCWGENRYGNLGLGDFVDRGYNEEDLTSLPFVDLGVGVTATSLALGMYHTCVHLSDGGVTCWGSNYDGQLGRGDTVDTWGNDPDHMGDGLVRVDVGQGAAATDLVAFESNTCARLDDGTFRCWGDNVRGRLGQGDELDRGRSPLELGDALRPVGLD